MSNEAGSPALPYSEIVTGGITYKMCFDYDALAEAETALLAKGVDANLNICMVRLNFSNTRTLFAASLHAYQPEIEFRDAVKLVTRDTLNEIIAAIVKAWNMNVPEAESSENPPKPEL